MALKQQSAVEFLSTYSFAIFLISIVLVVALAISLSTGTTPPIYSTCSIQPLISCQETLLTYTSNSAGNYFTYILVFRNNLGFLLEFPANAINLSVAGAVSSGTILTPGTCAPTLVGQGSQVVCKVVVSGTSSLRQGTNTFTQFHIYYDLCGSATSCPANTIYNVTGYSYQPLSPPYTNLFNLSILSQNGIVLVNGQSYFNGSVIYLTSGTYSVYAQPSSSYQFLKWSNSIVPIGSNSMQNTTVKMNANGNIIAIFNSIG